MLKGSWDNAILQPRYARLYLGLNVIFQEAVIPEGLHSIPIPFMRSDHAFIRYKKVILPNTYTGYKIRCDQEIERMERIQYEGILKPLIEAQLQMLRYIKEGPYDSNRG